MRLFLLLLTLTPLNLWASDKGIDSSEDIFKSRCVSCHGEATAALPVPRIMGQNRTFLFDELIKFKTNKRTDLKMGEMPAMVQGYSDDELNDLAAYISK